MNTITETQAKIYKHYSNGWTGKTTTTVNGQTFEITTLKTYNGKITSTALPVTKTQDGAFMVTSFSSDDMFNKKVNLLSEAGRATEKTIREQHAKAVILFDEKVNSGEVQPIKNEIPEIGTIIFMDGYGKGQGCYGNNHIVYKIEGEKYFTIEPDTLTLSVKDYVKPYSEKFGIGYYFDPEFKTDLTTDEINNLIIEAHQKKKADKATQEQAEQEKIKELSRKIEEGKKLVSIPNWANCVIVADLYSDESDSMTDYFATTIKDTVYLAFSKTTRNNMNELEKAKLNFEETKDLTESQTDGHSYLPDYFIGSSRWSGWKVNKRKYFDLTNEGNKNALYIAAAEGRFLIPEDEKQENVKIGNIEIVDYSDKAIAVIGETKPIKDDLKALGGRFNFRLTCGAGWIFQKTRKDEIQNFINNL